MKEPGLKFGFGALKNGRLGISAVYGAFLVEAASHCLRCSHHEDPVFLYVTGDVCMACNLKYSGMTERNAGTWADLQEATEYGAYGLAIIVALALTQTRRVERSARGTGVDYCVGDGKDQRGIFQGSARLEVSGILKGDKTKVAGRLHKKLAQTERSDNTGLPVGFSDVFRYSQATHFHDFSRKSILIDGNPDQALLLWTNRIRFPRLDMIADLTGIREAERCSPVLTSEGRPGCRRNSSG